MGDPIVTNYLHRLNLINQGTDISVYVIRNLTNNKIVMFSSGKFAWRTEGHAKSALRTDLKKISKTVKEANQLFKTLLNEGHLKIERL